jgi:uncharacterized membrane protein
MSGTVACPACGAENDHESVFCGMCHKALGEFQYVAEEFAAARHWFEVVAENVAGFVGRPHFVAVHALWFGLWVLLNTGVATVMLVRRFDEYPFNLLGILLAMEAVFLTGFLLISQNRQDRYAAKQAELDYEVNIRTYRRLEEVERLLREALGRLEAKEGGAGHGVA